jgi:hypothetical protein
MLDWKAIFAIVWTESDRKPGRVSFIENMGRNIRSGQNIKGVGIHNLAGGKAEPVYK